MVVLLDLAIIGAGPAGIMTAISASQCLLENQSVLTDPVDSNSFQKFKNPHSQNLQNPKPNFSIALFDSNLKLSRKLLLTGKGRCNFTNDGSIEDLISAFGKQGKFLYPAFYTFGNQQLRDYFDQLGVQSKVERGGRVFPESDHAEDIIYALQQQLKQLKVKQYFAHKLVKISRQKEGFGLLFENGQFYLAKNLVIATGGKSYPQTGSTGDGYRFAKQFGHTIISPQPALSALYTKENFVAQLAGLSLKNVELNFFAREQTSHQVQNLHDKLTVFKNQSSHAKPAKPFFSIFGEMLFTHKGISGPIVLTASKYVGEKIAQGFLIEATINLKPALNDLQLKARLERELIDLHHKELQTLLKNLLPKSLIPVFLAQTKLSAHQKIAKLLPRDIQTIIDYLQNFPLTIQQLAPIEQAIVTTGGVALNEVDPQTLQSKLQANLYFAGEILDLDAPTGGFNLQMSFSTGYLAGKAVVEEFTKSPNKTSSSL